LPYLFLNSSILYSKSNAATTLGNVLEKSIT
jgi:hypothetical protein